MVLKRNIILRIVFILVCVTPLFLISNVFANWSYSNYIEDVNSQTSIKMGYFTEESAKNNEVVDKTENELNNTASPIHQIIDRRKSGFLGWNIFGKTYVGTMDPKKENGDAIRNLLGLPANSKYSVILQYTLDGNDNVTGYIVYLTGEDLSKYNKGQRINNIYRTEYVLSSDGTQWLAKETVRGWAPASKYDEVGKLEWNEKIPSFDIQKWQPE